MTINMFTGRVISAAITPIVRAKPVMRIGPILTSGSASFTSVVFWYVKSSMLANIAVKRTASTQVRRWTRENGVRGCFVATENQRWPSKRLFWEFVSKTCPNWRRSKGPATGHTQFTYNL